MTTARELLQEAHRAINAMRKGGALIGVDDFLSSVDAFLAQPEPEPVAWMARFRGRFGHVDWTPWGPLLNDPRGDKLADWEAYPLYAAQPEPEPVAVTEDAVEWVVNDIAELGVKIGNAFFFLYKGRSLQYKDAKHDDGTPMHWRPVGKREFGECCHPVNYKDPTRIGTVSLDDSGEWKSLPEGQAMTTARELLQEARKLIVQVEEETAPWTKTLMSTLWGRDAKTFLDSADAFLAQPEPAAKPEPSAEVERVMELARKLYPVPQGIAQMDAEAALRAEVERLARERDDAKMHDQASGIQWRAQYERAEKLASQLNDYHGERKQLEMRAEVAEQRAEAMERERDAIRDEQRQDAGAMLSLATIQAKCYRLVQERDEAIAEAVAFARNLRGKHATTGATYRHLLERAEAAERDAERLRKVVPILDGLSGRCPTPREWGEISRLADILKAAIAQEKP